MKIQWSPEQIGAGAPISHETIYRHIYAEKASGGALWGHLRCQKSAVNDAAGPIMEAVKQGELDIQIEDVAEQGTAELRLQAPLMPAKNAS